MDAKQLIDNLMNLSSEEMFKLLNDVEKDIGTNYRMNLIKMEISITPFDIESCASLNNAAMLYLKEVKGISQQTIKELTTIHLDEPIKKLMKEISNLMEKEKWKTSYQIWIIICSSN